MPIHNQYYPDANNLVNTAGSQSALTISGPTIPVTIGPTPQWIQLLTTLKLPIPTPISGVALIDTGAGMCAIDESCMQQMGIPQFGYQQIQTPSGQTTQPTFPASLSFPGTPIPNITFTNFVGSPLQPQGILALIGRNVLAGFVMTYNGPGGHITLAF